MHIPLVALPSPLRRNQRSRGSGAWAVAVFVMLPQLAIIARGADRRDIDRSTGTPARMPIVPIGTSPYLEDRLPVR
jgi:hypothetical protein